MSRDDIIRMVREAGSMDFGADSSTHVLNLDVLARFATLVAATEREACAKACESAIASIWDYHDDDRKQVGGNVCTNLAAAIRARGDK